MSVCVHLSLGQVGPTLQQACVGGVPNGCLMLQSVSHFMRSTGVTECVSNSLLGLAGGCGLDLWAQASETPGLDVEEQEI